MLAMLLLCVGPLLSQWLLPAQAEPDCSEHAVSHSAAAGDSHGHDPLWAKCGYCTLLFSSPALTSSLLMPIGPLAFAVQLLRLRAPQHVPVLAVFPGSRSRAPPVRF